MGHNPAPTAMDVRRSALCRKGLSTSACITSTYAIYFEIVIGDKHVINMYEHGHLCKWPYPSTTLSFFTLIAIQHRFRLKFIGINVGFDPLLLCYWVISPIWVVKRPSTPTILSSIPWAIDSGDCVSEASHLGIILYKTFNHFSLFLSTTVSNPLTNTQTFESSDFVTSKTPSQRVSSGKQIILYFGGLTYVSGISSCSSYSDDVGVAVFCSSCWWLFPVLPLPCATHHPLIWKTCVKSSWQWGHCG